MRTIQSDPAPERIGRGVRVLLAEDNIVNQRVASRMLETDGYQVVVVGNGRDAIDAGLKSDFDLILMDVQMPEMDGFEATAAIRKAQSVTKRRVPIIAMTAHAMNGDRERCLAAGMDDYIAKPIRAAELRKLCSKYSGLAPAECA